MKATNLHNQN